MPTNFDAAVMRAALGAFGQAATVNGTAMTGVFDSRQILVPDVNGAPVSILQTMLTVKRGDLASLSLYGTTVAVNGSSYTVRDVQPDNLGAVTLVLEAQ